MSGSKPNPLPPLRYASSGVRFVITTAPMPQWVVVLIMLICCAPMIIVSQMAAHLRFDVVDDQMFGYFGWRIAHGGTVYLDVWDNKPPGIYWINALGFILGNDSYWGVIALCAVALVVTHLAFFGICASIYFFGASAVMTVLASFFFTHGYYQGGTNRTETFLVAFELLGVLCYFRGFARDRWWLFLLSGFFCGTAFLFKQVGLAAWGSMGLHLIVLMCTGELRVSTAFKRGLLMIVGAAVPISAAVAVLVSQGAWDAAWFAIVDFNRAYFATGDSSLHDNFANRYMLRQHMLPSLLLPLLMCAAALIHSFLWWLRPMYRPQDIEQPLREFGPAVPRPMLLFAVWWAVAFYGATVSPHHFRHYLIPTLAPMLLIAGYLINIIKTEVGLITRLQQRAWVSAAFVLMGWLAWDSVQAHVGEMSRVWWNRYERGKRAPWEMIGDAVKAYSTPDQKIHCWGYFPGVYLYAHRMNASRFTTTEKIGQVKDHAEFQRKELYDTLRNNPPPLFVVSAEDYDWFTDPNPVNKPRDWIGDWLGKWLDQTYQRVVDMAVPEANVYIYKRRDLVKPTDPDVMSKPTPPVSE